MRSRVDRRWYGRAVLALLAVAALAAGARAQGRRALASWWDRAPVRASRYYQVKTDLPLEEARGYGHHLDRMYREYARRLAALPARGPEQLRVFIFRTRADYQYTLRARWGIDAAGTGGMFFVTGTGSGLAFWTGAQSTRRVRSVIQHEGFHQFAYSRFGGDLPMWINEGLAEFFGQSVMVGDRLILGQSTPRMVRAVRDAIEQKTYVPFLRLLEMTAAQWRQRIGEGRAGVLYDQSWSMVHFLVYGDGERYQGPFERYLRLVNNGVEPRAAFTGVFGDDLEAFERRWKAYARRLEPDPFLTALERIEFLAEGALALSRREPDLAPARTLEELRGALRAIGFRHALTRHGIPAVLDAESDAVFTIPAGAGAGPGGAAPGAGRGAGAEAPAFLVQPAPRRRLSPRQQEQEQREPTPPAISTTNLLPRDLAITWIRDRRTGELTYDIIVQPKHR